MMNPLVVVQGGSAASPASDAIPSVVVAAEVDAGGVPSSASSVGARVEPIKGRLGPSGRPAMTAPHWPAPVGARVHVEGHGEGNYVGFDFNLLSRVAHTIDFDGGGETTLRSDFPCRDSWCLRRLCCCSATRPVASGWWVVDDPGSVQVSTLMAPEEPKTIALAPANMSMCQLRSEIARCFEVPPEQQRLVLQGEGQAQGDPGAEGSSGGDDGLVGEGSHSSATVWASGVRAGMRLLLVAADLPPADLPGLLHEGLESEVARVKRRARKIIFRCFIIVGALTGGIVVYIVDQILATPAHPWFKGVVNVDGHQNGIVDVVYGVLVGGLLGLGLYILFILPNVNKGSRRLSKALEGRDYVPLPRTRGWGTTA